MITRRDCRVAPRNAFRHKSDPNQKVSLEDKARCQTNKNLSRRGLVDRFKLLIKISGVQKQNFVRLSDSGTANYGLVKEVVTAVENQPLVAGIPIPQL